MHLLLQRRETLVIRDVQSPRMDFNTWVLLVESNGVCISGDYSDGIFGSYG